MCFHCFFLPKWQFAYFTSDQNKTAQAMQHASISQYVKVPLRRKGFSFFEKLTTDCGWLAGGLHSIATVLPCNTVISVGGSAAAVANG